MNVENETRPAVIEVRSNGGAFELVLNREAFPGHEKLFGGSEEIVFRYIGKESTRDFHSSRLIAQAIEGMISSYIEYKKLFGDVKRLRENTVQRAIQEAMKNG